MRGGEAMDFLDTNIIVYANDTRDQRKQKRCVDLITQALKTRQATISTQVFFEYANVALTKLGQSAAVVRRQIELLSSFRSFLNPPRWRYAPLKFGKSMTSRFGTPPSWRPPRLDGVPESSPKT